MTYTPQQDIFGNTSYDIDVLPTTRRIMIEKPGTYKSHRLLMREVAKVLGFSWIDKLDSDQKFQLETLLDLSPDFERSARKVREEREEQEKRAQLGLPVIK